MEEDKKYKEICKKLGCKPCDVVFPDFDTEDDSWVSPFSVLTAEENEYLYVNGYLNPR